MAIRRPLGRSGLDVFPLCLGTNVFGWSADRDASFAVLDAYVAAGGNFVDSANVYSAWVPGNRGGESETIIGEWLRSRGRPADLVVATKVGMTGAGLKEGLSREQIMRGIDDSLARLGVDRIDLYYAHQDDPDTPQAETLAALAELVADGRVGAIAASNFSAARLATALALSDEHGWPRYAAMQPPFNLMDREGYEGELEDLCRREGLGVATYFSLARGFLTGKYRPGQPVPKSPRAGGVASRYLTGDRGQDVLTALDGVAAAHGATPAQVALAWILARPGVSAAVASATSVPQLRELTGSAELRLSEAQVGILDRA